MRDMRAWQRSPPSRLRTASVESDSKCRASRNSVDNVLTSRRLSDSGVVKFDPPGQRLSAKASKCLISSWSGSAATMRTASPRSIAKRSASALPASSLRCGRCQRFFRPRACVGSPGSTKFAEVICDTNRYSVETRRAYRDAVLEIFEERLRIVVDDQVVPEHKEVAPISGGDG